MSKPKIHQNDWMHKPISATDLFRFWSKVDMRGRDECWMWMGGYRNPKIGNGSAFGYGSFKLGRGMIQSHRLAYCLIHGAIPPGMGVLHNCDNPSCCNPNHLRIGTQKDNSLDAANRNRTRFGSENGMAILTEDQVREILLLDGKFSMTRKEIGEMYGVHRITIGDILLGKSWKRLIREDAMLPRATP